MLRPATSIFTCAIFMLAVDPNHLAVMEDDEHVFLFTNIYIIIYIIIYLFTKFQAVCQEFPEPYFTCTYPKAKSNIGPTRVRTGFRLPTFNTSMPLDLVFKQRANKQWSLRCAGVIPVFFCSRNAAGMISCFCFSVYP